ncbi:hypothetical protein D6D13_00678 [Aureobasidium pullulans]|uniref:Nudix hydrolase domain-containing protein n=1 Tax=Aureobasidium pullulans TaxID=5580 RepID=A0A4S9DAN0_AURPU|nr:hypothetical protein D6D13_00678 [Aureobasidium pullulans]
MTAGLSHHRLQTAETLPLPLEQLNRLHNTYAWLPDRINMSESNTETTVYTSRNFAINCGGVIHDPDKNLYLILANRVGASGDISYSYKLPKGQKTETEDLLTTAIRETR